MHGNTKVILLSRQIEPQYKEFVENNENAKIYHTLEWMNVIQDTYAYKPYYLVALNNGSLVGILPLFMAKSIFFGKRLVSLPFSHSVNILYENEVTKSKLLEKAIELTEGLRCNYLEIRHGQALESPNFVKCAEYYDHILNLESSIDEIWKSFNSSTQRAIRKAEKTSMEIKRGTTLKDFEKFYNLELETVKRQGTLIYPFKFYENLYKNFFGLGKLRLYLAYYKGRPIAGIILTLHRDYAIYGYGASTGRREWLRLRPNNLLFWIAIQELKGERFNCLDLARTPKSNEGLLRFKSQWGSKSKLIPYYYYLNKSKKVPTIDRSGLKARVTSGLIRRMPISLSKSLGPILIKQIG